MTIACVHMSGLFVRSFRPLAKVGFATPVPDMPAVSVGQWVLRSFARHGSIDHAMFLPLQELVFQCSSVAPYSGLAAPRRAAVKAGRRTAIGGASGLDGGEAGATTTQRVLGRLITSQLASASAASCLPRRT